MLWSSLGWICRGDRVAWWQDSCTLTGNEHGFVVIEDSILGVQAAKNGGFDVFGFTAHDYNKELENEATKIFNDMSDLLEML